MEGKTKSTTLWSAKRGFPKLQRAGLGASLVQKGSILTDSQTIWDPFRVQLRRQASMDKFGCSCRPPGPRTTIPALPAFVTLNCQCTDRQAKS